MRQSMILRALIALLLTLATLVACTTPSGVRDRDPIPVPNLLDLSPVESLGYEIYLRDQAAWQATDAAMQAGLRETPSEGWITLLTPTGWLVRFVGSCGDRTCSYLDVERYDTDEPMIVTKHDGDPLSAQQAARWRARQTAIASGFRQCTPVYNTAVLEAEMDGSAVWRVYMLASSTHPQEVVLTGHHRITTTFDGKTILKEEPLSKSCVMNRVSKDVVALMITHILDPEPIETHVFTSLDYRMPLYVGTSEGQYRVKGASIEKID